MDLKTNYDIILDIKRNNYVAIRTKQLDKNSRFINVSVTDNGEPLSLDNTVSAMFIVKKNDGNTSEAPANIDTENNKIICEINDNMSATPGMNDAEIQLLDIDNKTILTTMKFKIVVDSINSTIDDLLSSSEYKSLGELVIAGKEKLELLDKLIDEIDDVQANYDEAEQARVAAETARVQAEKSRVSAESARVAAESKRASEESKRATAESSRETKESQRVEAETSRKQAETSRASAESGRVSAENTRVSNENARKSAETSRDNAEKSRVDAEQDRADAEEERITSESARKSAESSRVQTEANRVSAETSRANAETNRVNAEKVRVAAESSRATAEINRSDAENERVANENERKSAEASRVSAEASRVSAEQERAEAEKTRTTIHNGNGVPSSSLGKVGDVYIDKSDTASAPYNYYIKEASGWVAQGTMHGLNGSVVNYPNDSETDAPSTSLFEDAIVGGYLEQEGSTFSGATSDYGVDIHEIVGKTTQQTTNGYQLFDQSKISSSDGITATKNDDGSITLNGTATADADFFKIGAWNQSEVVLSGITKWKADVSNSNIIIIGVNGTSREISVNLSTAENGYTGELTYFLLRVPQGKTLNNFTFKFMLYQDGDGTWEPFTGGQPAPNPDYPMEVKNVEIKNIKSKNKNLFNLPTETFVKNGVTAIKNIDGSFTLNGTVTGSRFLMMLADHADKIKLEVGQQYTLSIGTILVPLNSHLIVGCYKSDAKTYIANLITFDRGTSEKTETIQTEHDHITAYFEAPVGSVFNNLTIYPMLEVGDAKTEFVDSKSSVVETSLTLAEGDVYENGVVTRKRKKVYLKDIIENVSVSSDQQWYDSEKSYSYEMKSLNIKKTGYIGLCSHFKTYNFEDFYNKSIETGIMTMFGQYIVVNISKSFGICSSVDEFKQWVVENNVYIEIEQETSTTETIKVPTIPSYHPYTNIWTDSPIEPEKIVWRAKTASGLAIENKERLDQVQYDGLYAQGETYSGIASNKGIKLHKAVGKTTQQTTNGYQLFDASKLPTKSAGGATVTNNGDGSFTISGSGQATATLDIKYKYSHEESLNLLKIGTLRINDMDITEPYFWIDIKYNGNPHYIGNRAIYSKSIEITSDILSKEDLTMTVGIYTSINSNIKSGTIKPMLYIDGDGTWEPFTGGQPAPNPDYPMEIENVEIKKIVSSSENIISTVPIHLAAVGCTYEFNDIYNQLIVNSTSNDPYVGNVVNVGSKYTSGNGLLYLVPKNAKKVYFKSLNGVFNKNFVNFYDENKISIGYKTLDESGSSISEGTKFMSVRFGVNSAEVGKSYADSIYVSFEEIGDEFVNGEYNEVETSITLAEGEVYEEGQPILRKRKKVVFDGSSDENWVMDSQNPSCIKFYIRQNSLVRLTDYTNSMKCNRFPIIRHYYNNELGVTGYIANESYPGENWIYVNGLNEFETAGEFKTWLQSNPIEVEYELATPTTETIKVPTIPSYNPHTNVWTDNQVPTDIEWELLANSDNSLQAESLEKRITALEATLVNVVSLMPESVQATMIENDVNNLMNTI